MQMCSDGGVSGSEDDDDEIDEDGNASIVK